MKRRIAVLNEIASSLLNSEISEYEKSLLLSNPKNFLYTLLKLDFDDNVEVQVVKNESDLVHLALPYYRDGMFADTATDAELEQAIGGSGGSHFSEEQMAISESGAHGFAMATRQFGDSDHPTSAGDSLK